jgi:hypothetical protein
MGAADLVSAQPRERKILILNSYHHGYPWSDNVTRGLEDVFNRAPFPIETFTRFMDTRRITRLAYLDTFKELLRVAYADVKFDLVVVSDNDAFEFTNKHRDTLFPGVPVVFCGINDYHDAMLGGRCDITGVIENIDYGATIETALALRPGATRVVIVTDGTKTGQAHLAAIMELAAWFTPRAKFEAWSLADRTFQEAAVELAALGPESVVLLMSHSIDKTKVPLSLWEPRPPRFSS